MQVSKWGNSLAIRLPRAVVRALSLEEGDEIEIRVAGDRRFDVDRSPSREDALAEIRKLRRRLPGGFYFDRDEIHER